MIAELNFVSSHINAGPCCSGRSYGTKSSTYCPGVSIPSHRFRGSIRTPCAQNRLQLHLLISPCHPFRLLIRMTIPSPQVSSSLVATCTGHELIGTYRIHGWPDRAEQAPEIDHMFLVHETPSCYFESTSALAKARKAAWSKKCEATSESVLEKTARNQKADMAKVQFQSLSGTCQRVESAT